MESVNVNDLQSSSTQCHKVRVNGFNYCHCGHSSYEQEHVVVRSLKVSIEHGAAIAISYGIGDFGRVRHVIGHEQGESDRPLCLELGAEWDVEGFKSELVNLTNSKGFIWMDQLSIPQNPEDIRNELQQVPNIYKMFEVVVMLPDAPCSCLASAFAQYQAGESFVWEDGNFDIEKVSRRCLNAFPVSSHPYRLWCKKEFGYARTISLAFCSPDKPSCMQGLVEWDYGSHSSEPLKPLMTKYLRYRYEEFCTRALAYGVAAREVAWSLLKQHVSAGLSAFRGHVLTFYMYGQNFEPLDIGRRLGCHMANLLLGGQLSRLEGEMEGHITFIGSSMAQSATVKKDYVLAVFPEMPTYEIPQDWQTMNLCELLDNAMKQYEDTKSEHFISYLPQGLFDLSIPGSTRFRPSLFIDETEVTSLQDIYGAQQGGWFHPITTFGHVMIRRLPQGQFAYRSRFLRSQTYKAAFGESKTDDALAFLRRVGKSTTFAFGDHGSLGSMEAWAQQFLKRPSLRRWEAPEDYWPNPDLGIACFRSLLYIDSRGWGDLPEIDHHEACYRLMCAWASISPEMARKKGLGLIVSREDPPCIGFVHQAVHAGLQEIEAHQAKRLADGLEPVPPPGERNRNNYLFSEDWLSVHTNKNPYSQIRKNVYEVMKVSTERSFDPKWIHEPVHETPVPQYMTVGVWYANSDPDPSIGAELTNNWGTCDAVIM